MREYPYYNICFTTKFTATQDFDNVYLGFDNIIKIKPEVQLEAIFQTDGELASFYELWDSEGLRGRSIFIATLDIFGTTTQYGLQQTTPLVNTIDSNGIQIIRFNAKVMFDPNTVENDPPIAYDKTVYIEENTKDAFIQLKGTDYDNDYLEFEIQVPPSNGTVSHDAPTILYTPDKDFNSDVSGPDCFSYVVKDFWSTSKPAVVTIVVGTGELPKFVVAYTVTAPIRVSGNFYYDRGDGRWERGYGGFITPINGDIIKIASDDHIVDSRDDVITSTEIVKWGERVDFTDFLKNKSTCTVFSIANDAGVCIGQIFNGMFEGTSFIHPPKFDLTHGIDFRRMFARSKVKMFMSKVIENGIYFDGMFEDSEIVRVPYLKTTKGQYFLKMFNNATLLECVGHIDTTQKINTAMMFNNTPLLTNPDAAGQSLIEGGGLFDNTVGCGVDNIQIAKTGGSETCEIQSIGGTCVSQGIYQVTYTDEVGTMSFNWVVQGGVISSGQGTDTVTVDVDEGSQSKIHIECVVSDSVASVHSGTVSFTHDRTTAYLELDIPKQYSLLTLKDFIDANNPSGKTEVLLTNKIVNCSMETGDLTGLTVVFRNTGEIQGMPKARTSANAVNNTGFTATTPMTLDNTHGMIKGAGGYGGKGGKGKDDTDSNYKYEKKYSYHSCNQATSSNYWVIKIVHNNDHLLTWGGKHSGWIGNVGTNWRTISGLSGHFRRSNYVATRMCSHNSSFYYIERRTTVTISRTGGAGGLGGRGQGYNQIHENGVIGAVSSPSGGNRGGRGGRGGGWGADGDKGATGAGGGSVGANGYAGADAIVGISNLSGNWNVNLSGGTS